MRKDSIWSTLPVMNFWAMGLVNFTIEKRERKFQHGWTHITTQNTKVAMSKEKLGMESLDQWLLLTKSVELTCVAYILHYYQKSTNSLIFTMTKGICSCGVTQWHTFGELSRDCNCTTLSQSDGVKHILGVLMFSLHSSSRTSNLRLSSLNYRKNKITSSFILTRTISGMKAALSSDSSW